VDKDGETKDRSALFDRCGKATTIGLGRPIARTLRSCVHLNLIGYVIADIGRNNRMLPAVADTRKITTVSANQPMVEAFHKKCIG
jgi:hypothetical protein